MKVRFDFVTNSSSSCFVVVFPEKITTIEQVRKFIPQANKAKQVFNDSLSNKQPMCNMKSKKAKKIISREIQNGFVDDVTGDSYKGQIDFCEEQGVSQQDFYGNHRWQNEMWAGQRIQTDISAKKYAEKFVTENPDGVLYLFDYGDDSGEFFSELEHGGTFANLPHIAISHH